MNSNRTAREDASLSLFDLLRRSREIPEHTESVPVPMARRCSSARPLTLEILFHLKLRCARLRPFIAGGTGAKDYSIAVPEPFYPVTKGWQREDQHFPSR